MKQKTKYILVTVLLLIISVVCGYKSGVSHGEGRTVHDTIRYITTDTVRIEKPVLVKSKPLGYRRIKIDSIRGGDSIREKDTVYIPYIQKEYSSERYRAYVSGYDVELDSLKVYPESTVIRTRIKPRRVGLGIIAGYGYGTRGLSPFVGLGIYYRIF